MRDVEAKKRSMEQDAAAIKERAKINPFSVREVIRSCL